MQRGLDLRLVGRRHKECRVNWALPPAWPSDASEEQPIKLPRQAKVTQEEYQQFLALGHGEIFSLDVRRTCVINNRGELQNPPWRMGNVDLNDYFNFGLDEQGWIDYCAQVDQYRMQYALQHNDPSLAATTPVIDEDEHELPPPKRGGMAHPIAEYDVASDFHLLPGGYRKPRDVTQRNAADSAAVTQVLFQPSIPCEPAPLVVDYGFWELYRPLGMAGITDFPKYHFNPDEDAMQQQAMLAMAQQVQRNLESAATVVAPGDLKMADGGGMMGEDFVENKGPSASRAAADAMHAGQAALMQQPSSGAQLDFGQGMGFGAMDGGEDLMGGGRRSNADGGGDDASLQLPHPMLIPFDFSNRDMDGDWNMGGAAEDAKERLGMSDDAMMDGAAETQRAGFDYAGNSYNGDNAGYGGFDLAGGMAGGMAADGIDGLPAPFKPMDTYDGMNAEGDRDAWGGGRWQDGGDLRYGGMRGVSARSSGGERPDRGPRQWGRGVDGIRGRPEGDRAPRGDWDRPANGRDRDRDYDRAGANDWDERDRRDRNGGAAGVDLRDRRNRFRDDARDTSFRGRDVDLRDRDRDRDRDRVRREPRDDDRVKDLRFRDRDRDRDRERERPPRERGPRDEAFRDRSPEGIRGEPRERTSRGGERGRDKDAGERPAGMDLRQWLQLKERGGAAGGERGFEPRGERGDRRDRQDWPRRGRDSDRGADSGSDRGRSLDRTDR